MKSLISLMGSLMISVACLAGVIVVPDDYPAIQTAIDTSFAGDTILVKPGTYHEMIVFNGKDVVVGSLYLTTGDTSYISQTIISAQFQGCAVEFSNNETGNARLSGFTITDGTGKLIEASGILIPHGGGIFISGASPTLDHLWVKGNNASGMTGGAGGGIFLNNSLSMISDCRFSNNEGHFGGGLRCDNSNVTVSRSTFINNFGVNAGGGAMFRECSFITVSQCTFSGNNGIYGGAICCNNSQVTIDRVTSYHNHGFYGGALELEGYSNAFVINSIFWENAMHPGTISEVELGNGSNFFLATHSDILGGEAGIVVSGTATVQWMEGNIDLYPEFADTSSMDLSLLENSPCVDAGTNLFIYNNDTLVNITDYYGAAPDMGSNERISAVIVPERMGYEIFADLTCYYDQACQAFQICFTNSRVGQVNIEIFDILGVRIGSISRLMPSGFISMRMGSRKPAPGIYLVDVSTGNAHLTKKVSIL